MAPDTRIDLRDPFAAARWALRFAAALLVVAGAMLAAEQLILAHSDAPWAQFGTGFHAAGIADYVADLRSCSGRIVWLGDSVVQTATVAQPDHRPMPQMLEAEIHDSVHMVTRAATSADLHEAQLSVLAGLRDPPRATIIPVNPRSFSPHWERNPGWFFEDEAAAVRHPLFARLRSVLEDTWGRPTDAEYRATPVIVGGREVGTVAGLEQPEAGWDPPASAVHGRYVTRYAADYRRTRRAAELRTLVQAANAASFPVILYITPIDVDAARACMTPRELAGLASNLRFLRDELAKSRWPHADLSEAVRSAGFDHPPGDPHEHLGTAGRLTVVHAVATLLVRAGVIVTD